MDLKSAVEERALQARVKRSQKDKGL